MRKISFYKETPALLKEWGWTLFLKQTKKIKMKSESDMIYSLKSLRGSEVNFFIGKSIMSAKRANRVLKDERPPLFYMQDNYENGERPNGDNHEKMKVNERKKGYRVEDSFLFKGICLATELPPLCLASDFKVSRFFTKKKALPNWINNNKWKY